MIKIIVILIFLMPSQVAADDWTDTDTAMQVLYSGLRVVDWNQTLQLTGRDDLIEANQMLGKYPSKDEVNLYFASTLLGHYFIARKLPQPYRAYWQMIFIVPQFETIENNNRNGLRVDFKF